MKWTRGYDSPNLEDRRGRFPGMQAGGLGMLLPLVGRLGLKGGLIVFALFALLYYGLAGPSSPSGEQPAAPHDDMRSFVGFVLDDAQHTWARLFRSEGRGQYEPARVVLFDNATDTACGYGSTAVGPFYCPRDHKVYLDLSFFRTLDRSFGAPGDFAQAYVIAHEIGHHVQNQRGVLRGKSSVSTELQADCYAGVWARAAGRRDLLDPGDLEEALQAAAAVGDDRLQKNSSGTVQPETWTHGSAVERAAAFRRGYDGASPGACE